MSGNSMAKNALEGFLAQISHQLPNGFTEENLKDLQDILRNQFRNIDKKYQNNGSRWDRFDDYIEKEFILWGRRGSRKQPILRGGDRRGRGWTSTIKTRTPTVWRILINDKAASAKAAEDVRRFWQPGAIGGDQEVIAF